MKATIKNVGISDDTEFECQVEYSKISNSKNFKIGVYCKYLVTVFLF